jgi:predicted secreted hydrolase
MLKKSILVISALLFSSSVFANLPYSPIQFPRDEAAHYDNVPYPVGNMSEWWYYNGKLTTTDGRNFGYYVSYNYFQLDFNGNKIVVPMLQIQITDIDKKVVYGNSVVVPSNETEFNTRELQVKFNKDITLRMDHGTYVVNAAVKSKQGTDIRIAFRLTPAREVLLVNEIGYADMWSDTNTYYYSQTHLDTMGTLEIGKEKLTIDEKHSLSWMDHQWGDFFVIPGIHQWTWSSVQLENGLEVNIDTVLDPRTHAFLSSLASIVMPDGSHVYTRNIKITPRIDPGHQHPLYYTMSVPDIHLEMTIESLVPDQDVNGISEGISGVTAVFDGKPVKGYAYAESTIVQKQ